MSAIRLLCRPMGVCPLVAAGVLVLVLGGRLCHALDAQSEDSPAKASGKKAARVLHFPKGRSVGLLRIAGRHPSKHLYPERAVSPGLRRQAWLRFAEARGDVTVPADKRIGVFVDKATRTDLTFLSRLGPDDLEMLLFPILRERAQISSAQMQHLAALSGLKELHLYDLRFTREAVHLLARLQSLERLFIGNCAPVDNAFVARLAELKRLRALQLHSEDVSDAGLAQLGKSESLEELSVSLPNVRGAWTAHIAKLPSLRELHVGKNTRFTDVHLRQLKKAVSLRKLVLTGAGITDAGLAHLSHLDALEELDLSDTSITGKGLAHLKMLRSLRKLSLRHRNNLFDGKALIGDDGLAHLTALRSLECLDLPNIGITDRGLAHLSSLGKLKYLWVGCSTKSAITDRGLEHLAGLGGLETLYVGGEGITDAGMSHVAKLERLEKLQLYRSEVTNEGLAELSTLKSLTHLDLGFAKVTTSGLKHLNALPNLIHLSARVYRDDDPWDIGGLARLEWLELPKARDEDLACIAKLTRLRWLSFRWPSPVTDAGMAHLAGLTALESLAIGGPNLTDQSLAHLAKMKRLERLTIGGNFTDKGLRHLEGLEALRMLRIATVGDFFSPEAVKRLRRNLPKLSFGRARLPLTERKR